MARPRQSAKPRKRDGFWYFIRLVPREFAHLDKRRKVVVSVGIRIADDPRAIRARRAVQSLDVQLEQYWEDLKAGRDPEAIKSFERAKETASRFGFEYREAEVLKQQFGEFLQRMVALAPLPDAGLAKSYPALLGEVAQPRAGVPVKELLTRYEKILAALLKKKSPEQLKRWRTTRSTALSVFLGVIGKKASIEELTHEDGFAFRDHWNKRILAGEVQIDSANKQISYVAAMYREVRNFERISVDDIFQGKVIKGGESRQRRPFSIEHVQNVLLAPGAMDGLNDEARGIFYMVAELGLRPSEVCGLVKADIQLDAEVPFIEIVDGNRELKTMNSRRTMPLVGVALEVMQHFPEGFERYREKADSLSAAVNKYLRSNGLLECKGQTFYSLRHTFKDRLRRMKVEDELKDMLMGHSTGKEPYGDGYVLERKREVLNAIAFKAPSVCFGEGRAQRAIARRHCRVGLKHPPTTGTAMLARSEAQESGPQ